MLHRLPQRPKIDDRAILDELRRVASLIGDKHLTLGRFARHARVSYCLVHRRFGGWRQALEAAGIGERYTGRKISRKQRDRPAARLSDTAILKEMRRLAKAKGGRALLVRDLDASSALAISVLRARFGSWPEALRRAGLTLSALGRRYTGNQCFANLMTVWRHCGRPPTKDDMARHPSRIGAYSYVQRFGTWHAALEAFVRRASVAPEDHAARRLARIEWEAPRHRHELARFDPDARATSASTPDSRAELATFGQRASVEWKSKVRIGKGLRFQVLARDRFRCTACGNGPARDPDCTLHVDHIAPVSKGGRTVPENLRALCAACNIGRGNRAEG